MLELIGTEHMELSNKEMDMIAQLVIKEEEMETMEKMNKVQKLKKDDNTTPPPPPKKTTNTAETVSKATVPPPIVDSKIVSDSKIPQIPPSNDTNPDKTNKL